MTGFIHSKPLRSQWYPVAESNDVDHVPVSVTLLGDDFVLWRSAEGALAVAPNRCPHREAPLSLGSVDGNVLRCSYHGWGFGTDGRCVDIPSSGPGAAIPPAAHLHCGRVEERYGLVWVCPGDPDGRIPSIPQEADPAFRRINTGIETWSASAPRLVDNFMDISHFPWVHTGTFGRGQEPVVPKIRLVELGDGYVGYEYEVFADNPEEAVAASGRTDDVVHRVMSTGFHLPFTVRSTIRYDDGLEHILLLCAVPVDDLNSLFTFVVWRNDDHATEPEDIIGFDRAIGAEDRAMLERVPGTLSLERSGVVSVQSDKPSVEWRRRFVELIGAEPR